jgi:hypothetical protein
MALPKYSVTPEQVRAGMEAAKAATRPYSPPVQNTQGTSTPAQATPNVQATGTPAPGSQASHQGWINNAASGMGGMDAYTQRQQERYTNAVNSGDAKLIAALQADASRVGYNLQGGVQGGGNQDMDAILAFLKQQGDAAYQQEINSIQAAYNQAVMDGQMSVNEAQEAFRRESERIAGQAYTDGEATKLNASQRGIGNSQQLLGMQASDQSRANSLRSESSNVLNTTLSNIRQRLSAISLQKDLDISSAGARRDAQYAQGAFDMMREDYGANRDYGYQLGLVGANQNAQSQLNSEQHQYALAEMKAQSGLTIEQMKVKLGIDKELGAYMNDLDLVKMAKANGYDLDKMKLDQTFQKQMLAAQQAFTAKENGKDRAQSAANAAASANKDDGYALALQRQLAQYTPGTPEYMIVQKQLESEKARASNTAFLELQTDILMDKVIKGSVDLTQYSSLEEALKASGVPAAEANKAKSALSSIKSGGAMGAVDAQTSLQGILAGIIGTGASINQASKSKLQEWLGIK